MEQNIQENKPFFRIGSRESMLAVVQSKMVLRFLEEQGARAELVTMKTTGDKILDRTLDQIGGKGLFVKELDRALLDQRTELSVHSLKDLPVVVSEDLPVIAFSKREDPRDVLVLPKGKDTMDPSLPIGCASKRRMIQLKKLYPDMSFKPVRGNLQTRLRKLEEGQYSALVLAAAGLKRLGMEERISRYFSTEEVLPAAGQAILAVQGRTGVDYGPVKGFDDREGRLCALCERAFVRYLDGGCSSPESAFAKVNGDTIVVTGLYYDPETEECVRGSLEGDASDPEGLGIELAKELKKRFEKGERF